MNTLLATQCLLAITLILMGGIGLTLFFTYFQWRKLKKDDHLILYLLKSPTAEAVSATLTVKM